MLVSMFIQKKIDDLDAYNARMEMDAGVEDFSEIRNDGSYHSHLRTAQKKVSFSIFEARHLHDPAFKNFRKKLANHLTEFMRAYSIPLPDNKPIRLSPNDTVRFGLSTVCYVSQQVSRLSNIASSKSSTKI